MALHCTASPASHVESSRKQIAVCQHIGFVSQQAPHGVLCKRSASLMDPTPDEGSPCSVLDGPGSRSPRGYKASKVQPDAQAAHAAAQLYGLIENECHQVCMNFVCRNISHAAMRTAAVIISSQVRAGSVQIQCMLLELHTISSCAAEAHHDVCMTEIGKFWGRQPILCLHV